MNFGDMVREGRIGMIAIGRSLSPDEAEVIVPGCPEWTIKDVYAHQAGVVADAIAGRLEGVATDPWTARQVEERANRPLNDILDEWEAAAPQFEEFLSGGGPPEVIFDQWTHEQDIRATIDLPGNRDDARAEFCIDALSSGWESWKHEPVAIVTDTRTFRLGDGEPKVTLRTTDFDFIRAAFGRRSRAQVLAMDWDGDPTPFVDDLVIFSWAENDQPA
jgi:uncharacterized protein (TIGR03083 family)